MTIISDDGRRPNRIKIPPDCDLTLGLVCIDKAEDGVTAWQMQAEQRFTNPGGTIQGGFLAAMADSAMAVAAVTANRGRKVHVTNTDIQVRYISPAHVGSTLTCTARTLAVRRRVAFVEAEIVDDDDRLIAKATSTFLVSEREAVHS